MSKGEARETLRTVRGSGEEVDVRCAGTPVASTAIRRARWPARDQLKAKGLVASVRESVNVKDSFTRMKLERDAERAATLARQRAEQTLAAGKRAKIEQVNTRLAALFGMDDKPRQRGKLLRVFSTIYSEPMESMSGKTFGAKTGTHRLSLNRLTV